MTKQTSALLLPPQPERWIIALAVLLFTANIWGTSIYILDEAKNAEAAREMWEQNDWIVPTYNYELRTDKPPLHYYFMMLAYSIFGATPFAARLFSALCGVLTVWLTFHYTRRFSGTPTAWFSALSLLASMHLAVQFHLAVPDPYLILCITTAIFAFFTGIVKEEARQLYLGYVAAALGVLAKGPVALGLVGLIMLLFLFASKRLSWQQLGKLRLLTGGLLFLVIAVPWYVAVGLATDGAWLEGFFVTHNLERFSDEMEGHGGSFLLIPAFVLAGLLPFSIFIPQTLHHSWKHREQDFIKLALIAAGVIIGFFSLSQTKLPNYPVPSYPFLAVLFGFFIHKTHDAAFRKKYRTIISLVFWLVLATAFPFAAYFGLQTEGFVDNHANLSWVVLPIPIGAWLALIWHQKGKIGQSVYALGGGTFLAAVLFFYFAFPKIDQTNPVVRARFLLENEPEIGHYVLMNRAFIFNLQREIPKLRSKDEVRTFVQNYPYAPIITFERYLPALDSTQVQWDTLFLQKDLFENATTVILKQASE